MSRPALSIVVAALSGASCIALAQSPTDRTFTATGTRCEDVNWASQTLARYPRVADACQSVVERDGQYFVVFSGTVRKVSRAGREVTLDFKDGDRVTLRPSADMRIDVNGVKTRFRDLRRGDTLTFYVPQDRFVAEIPEGTKVSVPIPITQWEPQRIALAAPAKIGPAPATLPKTAGERGILGLAGLALVAIGASLTMQRLRRQRHA